MDQSGGTMKEILVILVLLLAVVVVPPLRAQEDYPNKPIQLICPFPPGATVDLSARVVADKMGEILRQPFVIVNKPGGGTSLAAAYVAGSRPDGYTIYVSPPAPLIFPPMFTPDLPVKASDFMAIGRLVSFNFLMLVNKDVPAKTLPELIAYIKKSPGTLSYGGSTFGSLHHLIGELFKMTAQVDLQFIPYAGENPAITALLGNHIQVGIFTTVQQPHVRANAVKAIAAFSAKRDPFVPQVATAVEQGYPDLSIASGGNLFLAPVKTPASIVKRLEEAMEKALQDPAVRQKLEKLELTVDFLNSKNSQLLLESEIQKWTPVVKKAIVVGK